MARLLGIDVGTSGCKAIVTDESGSVLAQASATYPISMPHPTWSEQNPEDWWQGVVESLNDLGGGQLEPTAIGLTGQMHGAVFLDADGEVIRPAILWNDQRTVEECEEIDRRVGAQTVRKITGNPPLTGFQLPKLLWLRKHEPENYARVRTVLLPKDYIRYKLTGQMATDVSDASGTGILDVRARSWSKEIAQALDIDLSFFPPCYESSQTTGQTNDGIPTAAGAGDQAAGAVGTGAVKPGIISVSLGTSGVVFTGLDQPNSDPSGALHTFCHANGKWHAMGVMLSCGGALSWYRKAMSLDIGFREIDEEAARAAPGCGGLTFLPYLCGERSPHNDPNARAAWAGLDLTHGRAEMSRSVLEGITFGLRDGLEMLKRLGVECREVRITGGGAKSAFWCQLIADVFQTSCHTLAADEGPAFGAALLAGVSVGVWKNVEEASASTVKSRQEFLPSGIDYSQPYERFRSLYPALKTWNQDSSKH